MAAIELHSTSLISDANLQAYYQLEDVTDHQGSYNLTNNNSVAFNAAKYNNGGDLGAANSNKNLEVLSNLSVTGSAVSISMWTKMQTEIDSGEHIFVHLSTGASNYRGFYIGYQYNSGTRRIIMKMQREGIEAFPTYYNITLGTTNWHHLVCIYNGTNVYGYVDNNAVSAVAASGTGDSDYSNAVFSLGCYRDAKGGLRGEYSSVIFDDVAVFNRALTSTEVSNLYTGSGWSTATVHNLGALCAGS